MVGSTRDDIGRLVAIVTRDMVLNGRAAQLRQAASVTIGEVAKAAGATPEMVGMWEAGRLTPSTGQALAWLAFVTEKASWRETAGGLPCSIACSRIRRRSPLRLSGGGRAGR